MSNYNSLVIKENLLKISITILKNNPFYKSQNKLLVPEQLESLV